MTAKIQDKQCFVMVLSKLNRDDKWALPSLRYVITHTMLDNKIWSISFIAMVLIKSRMHSIKKRVMRVKMKKKSHPE